MFADRGDSIGVKNSAFEEIQSPKKLNSMESKKPLWQICQPEIQSPKTPLVSYVMDRQDGFEWQPLRIHKYRHQRRGPIVQVQNFHLRRQPPSQFQRCFAKENESRGIIFVRLTTLAVNSRAIKKLITTNQKQLHAAGAPPLEVPGNVSLIAHLHIDSYAGVRLLECTIFLNFAVERQSDAYFMSTHAQRAWQRIHHIHERARSL